MCIEGYVAGFWLIRTFHLRATFFFCCCVPSVELVACVRCCAGQSDGFVFTFLHNAFGVARAVSACIEGHGVESGRRESKAKEAEFRPRDIDVVVCVRLYGEGDKAFVTGSCFRHICRIQLSAIPLLRLYQSTILRYIQRTKFSIQCTQSNLHFERTCCCCPELIECSTCWDMVSHCGVLLSICIAIGRGLAPEAIIAECHGDVVACDGHVVADICLLSSEAIFICPIACDVSTYTDSNHYAAFFIFIVGCLRESECAGLLCGDGIAGDCCHITISCCNAVCALRR